MLTWDLLDDTSSRFYIYHELPSVPYDKARTANTSHLLWTPMNLQRPASTTKSPKNCDVVSRELANCRQADQIKGYTPFCAFLFIFILLIVPTPSPLPNSLRGLRSILVLVIIDHWSIRIQKRLWVLRGVQPRLPEMHQKHQKHQYHPCAIM